MSTDEPDLLEFANKEDYAPSEYQAMRSYENHGLVTVAQPGDDLAMATTHVVATRDDLERLDANNGDIAFVTEDNGSTWTRTGMWKGGSHWAQLTTSASVE
jgi:hypothetical protein